MARMVLFLQMFETRRAIRRERVFRDRTNPFDSLEDTELYSRYRFRRNELLEMVHEIKPEIEHRTRRNEAVSAENQFLTALRFYATGAFQELVGDSQGIHKSTVSRIISRVSSVLAKKLPKYVQFPVDDEGLKSTMDAFYAIAEFPGVIGCIDGTQIRIQAPISQEYEYVNRKGYHSLNIQLMCNADCKIINCVVKWPGSTHDSRILKESKIYREFEEGLHDGILLGDSGYPLKPWLMTPVLAPKCRAEERYNGSYRTTRTVIERCNGILKRRFHCLHGELRVSPERVCNIVAACIVLHNRAVDYKHVMDEDTTVEPMEDSELDPTATNSTQGTLMRQRIIASHFSH